mmetsp:Transcript_70601/g.151269  ORF Transcript_70601/g.151269 Transcript_70601/m.151269 type:complete len:344 (-) Transcript_70601:102-1133(-)
MLLLPRRLGGGGRECGRHGRCRRRLVPNEFGGLVPDILDGKVGELHRVAALSRLINPARSFHVLPLSVHPEHVRRAPVADHRGHTRFERHCELLHGMVHMVSTAIAGVVPKAYAKRTVLAHLRERNLHGRQYATLIHREGDLHFEGLLRVHAPGTRAKSLTVPVPRSVPTVAATAVAAGHAALVCGSVQGRVPRTIVSLLDVNLCARLATNIVRIAIEVPALRLVLVLLHGDEIERDVATARRLRHVGGVTHRLPKQIEPHVLLRLVRSCRANIREIRPATHGGRNRLLIVHRDFCTFPFVPPCGNNLDGAIALHVELARTSVTSNGSCGEGAPEEEDRRQAQ